MTFKDQLKETLEHVGGRERVLQEERRVLRKVSKQDDLKALLFSREDPGMSKMFVLCFGRFE